MNVRLKSRIFAMAVIDIPFVATIDQCPKARTRKERDVPDFHALWEQQVSVSMLEVAMAVNQLITKGWKCFAFIAQFAALARDSTSSMCSGLFHNGVHRSVNRFHHWAKDDAHYIAPTKKLSKRYRIDGRERVSVQFRRATNMAVNEQKELVNASWLHDNLARPDIKILDASWYLPSMGA
jgi:hypothetical protein